MRGEAGPAGRPVLPNSLRKRAQPVAHDQPGLACLNVPCIRRRLMMVELLYSLGWDRMALWSDLNQRGRRTRRNKAALMCASPRLDPLCPQYWRLPQFGNLLPRHVGERSPSGRPLPVFNSPRCRKDVSIKPARTPPITRSAARVVVRRASSWFPVRAACSNCHSTRILDRRLACSIFYGDRHVHYRGGRNQEPVVVSDRFVHP